MCALADNLHNIGKIFTKDEP